MVIDQSSERTIHGIKKRNTYRENDVRSERDAESIDQQVNFTAVVHFVIGPKRVDNWKHNMGHE